MKNYTLEVVKEDRALVTLQAENGAKATEAVNEMIAAGTIDWAQKDNVLVSIVASAAVK